MVSLSFFFFQLPQGSQCLFDVISVPDYHCIRTNLVRTNPPIPFTIVNFLWSQMVGMIFVRIGDKDLRFDQVQSYSFEIFISFKSVVDTQEVLLLALLLELMGDVIFLVSWLLPVTVPVKSPFLYIVVKNRKEIHCVLDEFPILLFLFTRSAACAVDDAVVLILPLIGMQNPSHPVATLVLQADLQEFLCRCCSNPSQMYLVHEKF